MIVNVFFEMLDIAAKIRTGRTACPNVILLTFELVKSESNDRVIAFGGQISLDRSVDEL